MNDAPILQTPRPRRTGTVPRVWRLRRGAAGCLLALLPLAGCQAPETAPAIDVARAESERARLDRAERRELGRRLLGSCYRGEAEAVRILLEKGADPNAPLGWHDAKVFPDVDRDQALAGGPERWSPLIAAIHSGEPSRLAIARMLLAAGADFNHDSGAGPPLLHAAAAGDQAFSRFLIEQGADPDLEASTPDGRAPLHAAAHRPALVRLLLEHGADPNRRDNRGNTPLHHAVRATEPESVERLLDAGADPDARGHFGRTPAWYVTWQAARVRQLRPDRHWSTRQAQRIAERLNRERTSEAKAIASMLASTPTE